MVGDALPCASVSPTRRLTALFLFTYTQFRSEPGHQAALHDWLNVLSVLQRAFDRLHVRGQTEK